MHIDGKEVKRQTSVNRMSSSVSSTTIKPKATTKSSWGYKPPQVNKNKRKLLEELSCECKYTK